MDAPGEALTWASLVSSDCRVGLQEEGRTSEGKPLQTSGKDVPGK